MIGQPQRAAAGAASPRLDLSLLMDHGGIGQVVLHHLASTQERVRICRSVSKECRDLVDSQISSLRANLRALASPGSASLPLHLPRLRSLSFERADGDASPLLAQLARWRPQLLARLEQLDLANCQGLEAGVLEQLLVTCGRLRSLTLPALAGSSGVTSPRASFLEVLSTHGTQLTQLLGAGDYADSASLPLLARLPALQHLDLSPGKASSLLLTPAALRPLSALGNLRSLTLGNHLARYDTCDLAASLPKLESLAFTYVVERAPMGPPDLQPLAHHRSLRSLQLCGVVCSDEMLEVLAATRVSALVLPGCSFTASAKGLSRLQGRLQRLTLRANDGDALALAAALPGLPGLTHLALSIHRATADLSTLMAAVFSLAGSLEELTLESHYNRLREDELRTLPLLPHLRRLSLCNHFSDATLARLLACAPGLRELRLSSCGAVGDAGLSGAAALCPRLHSVSLELMRGASIVGVGALAAAPCMERVELAGCRNVAASECAELMQRLNKPHLEVVRLR